MATFVGRKRINFSLKNSYEYRCKAAAISYNTKSNFLCKIEACIFGEGPGYFTKRFVATRQKQNISNLNSTRKSFKKRVFATVDENYGLVPENKEDMDTETYETKSKEFLQNLSRCDREKVFNETILQSHCDLWKNERKKRLTASNFGKICKLRKSTSTAKTVENLLYSTFKGNSATRFGLENPQVGPSQEATLAYSFIPSEAFAGRPFGLNINLAYRDIAGNNFQEAVFNETVQIVELEEGLDGETFFLYVFLAAGVILLLVIRQQTLLSMGRKRTSRKMPVETGTSNPNNVNYEWLPIQTLANVSK